MADHAEAYLHMDDLWMWRFFFLDHKRDLIAVSTMAYFTRTEAEEAMRRFHAQSVVMLS